MEESFDRPSFSNYLYKFYGTFWYTYSISNVLNLSSKKYVFLKNELVLLEVPEYNIVVSYMCF